MFFSFLIMQKPFLARRPCRSTWHAVFGAQVHRPLFADPDQQGLCLQAAVPTDPGWVCQLGKVGSGEKGEVTFNTVTFMCRVAAGVVDLSLSLLYKMSGSWPCGSEMILPEISRSKGEHLPDAGEGTMCESLFVHSVQPNLYALLSPDGFRCLSSATKLPPLYGV